MIGYLAVDRHGPVGYVGGRLVVDEVGLPVEFRHTLPVRPTKLQRALYGDALDRYVRTVVVARRLLETLDHDPALVLAADPLLLLDGEPPVAHAAVAGVDPIGAAGTVEPLTGTARGFLLQLRPGEAPLRVLTSADPERHGELGGELRRLAETMDLAEPAGRVSRALSMIAAGDVAAA